MQTNAIFGHAVRVYSHMLKNSTEITWEDLPIKAWEGSITQLTADLRISNSYYTRVVGGLEASGCISMLRRGSGNRLSLLALHHPPSEESFISDLTPRLPAANLVEQRLKDLETNVGGINIAEAIADIQERLEVLEREVDVSGKTEED